MQYMYFVLEKWALQKYKIENNINTLYLFK
jgi:hypothetical protein